MLGTARPMGFIPTTDYGRARAFYVDVLGLALVAETPFALVLESDGLVVRVTKVPSLTPHPFTVFGWQVPDIDATVAALVAAGIVFQRYDLPGRVGDVWTAPDGAKVAWFQDPDGNLLSVSQHPE